MAIKFRELTTAGSGESTLKKLLDYTQSTIRMFGSTAGVTLNYTDLTGYFDYNETENVKYANYMFNDNKNIQVVPSLNLSNLTDATGMFSGANALISVGTFNTNKCTTMAYMFKNCQNFESIPSLDVSYSTSFYDMFTNCYKLKTLPRLNLRKYNNINFALMFSNCRLLEYVDLSYFQSSDSTKTEGMFNCCYSLKAIVIRELGTSYTLNNYALYDNYHFKGTVNSTYNPNGDKDGYIYVPRNKVNTIKSATNWSVYADQIRALEDYTLDGTTTGELNLTAMGLGG